MKNLVFSFTALVCVTLFLLTTTSAKAQADTSVAGQELTEKSPIVVVINTADWCGTCKKHKSRFLTEVIPTFENDTRFMIIYNDLSTDETKMQNNEKFEDLGISEITNELRYTGVIYFISTEEMRVMDNIGMNKSNENIVKAFNKFE